VRIGPERHGITYKADDTHLHRLVALKLMDAVCLESEIARHRFLDEAQAFAALQQPLPRFRDLSSASVALTARECW
jgi:hypothetical protein